MLALASSKIKYEKTGVSECAASGEADIYTLHRKILSSFGVQVEVEAGEVEYCGIPVTHGAHVVLHPSFGTTVKELEGRFPTPGAVKITANSTLVVEGDVTIKSLDLDGALVIRAAPGAAVVVNSCVVKNEGYTFEALGGGGGEGKGEEAGGAVPEKCVLGEMEWGRGGGRQRETERDECAFVCACV